MSLVIRSIIKFNEVMNREIHNFIMKYIGPIIDMDGVVLKSLPAPESGQVEYRMVESNGEFALEPIYDQSLVDILVSQRVLSQLLFNIYQYAYTIAIIKSMETSADTLLASLEEKIKYYGDQLAAHAIDCPEIATAVLDFMTACQSIEDTHKLTFSECSDVFNGTYGFTQVLMVKINFSARLLKVSGVFGEAKQ